MSLVCYFTTDISIVPSNNCTGVFQVGSVLMIEFYLMLDFLNVIQYIKMFYLYWRYCF